MPAKEIKKGPGPSKKLCHSSEDYARKVLSKLSRSSIEDKSGSYL
jgi:hypothetical protein